MAATVVLVHGAWHGAWCWDLVASDLRQRGIDVVAVDLPGHGDDTGPCTDLTGDVARVREVLDAQDGPVVLAGHSYGGLVVTDAGAHPAVRHLVYIAALNPDAGETPMTMATEEAAAAHIDHHGRPNPGAYMTVDDDGMATLSAEGAHILFYEDCTDEQSAWAISRLCPQPMGNLQQGLSAIGWHDRPSTYAVCLRDNIMHPDLQRILARRATNAVEWDTSHSPFLSRPDLVAGLLADIATATA